MSLSESQIKQLVREEVRRIVDAGLMYTAQCVEKPSFTQPQTATTPTPQPSPLNILDKFPEQQRKHLTLMDDGTIRTEYVSHERWIEINTTANTLGYRWVKNISDPKLSHWEK
jgi:hypothetical protein